MKLTYHEAGTASNRCELTLATKKHFLSAWLRRLTAAVLGAAALALTINTASAQTSANADTVYNGFLNAYLVTTHVAGYNPAYPLPYICQSITNRDLAFMWQQAYMISGLEDAEDKDISTNRLNLISSLLTGFLAQNLTNLTWDSWNDDIEWACIALVHGYQETGNTNYLSAAELNWNAVWSRGWDTTLGGGIWENQSKPSKLTLSNAPFIIAGCMLYRATGNSTYLTESEQSYSWMRANCFNTSTGQAIEGVASNGTQEVDSNVYNSGIFLQAANALNQVTGTSSYYNDALLAIGFVVNNNTVMNYDYPNNGPFGSEEFFRGLSLFARYNNLWATYYPWLQANAQAAWNNRRTDYNITWNHFAEATPTTNLLAMETISSVIIQAVTEIDPSGTFELRNAASSLSLNVSGNATTNGAEIIQWPYSGSANSQWTFVLNPTNGYHQLVSNSSGLDAAVLDASTSEGAGIVQWAFGGAGNDQWLVAQTISGNRILINLHSGMLLEDPGSSTAQGTQMDQWGSNDGSNQRWALIRH